MGASGGVSFSRIFMRGMESIGGGASDYQGNAGIGTGDAVDFEALVLVIPVTSLCRPLASYSEDGRRACRLHA